MRDSDVRKAALEMLALRHANDIDTRIVEEMCVWSGSVRIDIAVINGELSGFELKSDSDTLQRLPLQSSIYSRVFDRIDIIVGQRHKVKVEQFIPEWWGISIASSSGTHVSIAEHRSGKPNPEPDAFLIAQLLWKVEAIGVLELENLAKGWKGKKIRLLHERLASELPLEKLREYVRSALKNRMGWLGQNRAGQFYVPVDTNPHPVLKIARRLP